ncbi:type II deoxyribonuclease [Clostridia bacterium]|nr:type II deoxyribonuclease [Clostridia bacterium]
MNKTAIKKYATAARLKLIEAVSQKMRYYGFDENGSMTGTQLEEKLSNNGVHLDDGQKRARAALYSRVAAHGFQTVVEEVAYTWFNRLAAIRFMEVNGYLPSGINVLSSGGANHLEPECVREYRRVDYIDQAKTAALQAESDEALYRYILVKQCNELGKILPGMFSSVTDYAELLLPDRLFAKDCIVYDLANSPASIPAEDFGEQVEIIGWLYQYYISEKKDEVFAALKKNVKITKENVPAATQLFTPDWIVRYMVENSLGRLWLENHPDDELLSQWKYYVLDAEQTPEVEAEIDKRRKLTRNIKPEDIRFIDPCMGSGHILVYAFDVLFQIYVSAGYAERDIPDLILTHNLYGLDIDERACQLTYFALNMKARAYNRRFFRRDTQDIPQPQMYSANFFDDFAKYTLDKGDFLLDETYGTHHQETLDYMIEAFRDIDEYGSLLKLENRDYAGLLEAWNFTGSQTTGNFNMTLWYASMEKVVPSLAKLAIVLSQKYDVVVTNPPYMGASGMGVKLAEFVKKNYPDSKSDMFAAFIERCGQMLKPHGYQAMITQHAWMFLSSYEKLRGKLLARDIINMAHLGARAFEEIGGEVVQTTAFVLNARKTPVFLGTYARLVDFGSQAEKEIAFLSGEHRHTASADNFAKIPGSPVAYWVSEAMLRAFEMGTELGKLEDVKSGLSTTDNNRFLRYWFEVIQNTISFSTSSIDETNNSDFAWYPIAKGGDYRKWYGNLEYVVNWENNGSDIREAIKGAAGGRIVSPEYYFKKIITWSGISSGEPSMRIADKAIFGSGAKAVLPSSDFYYYLAFLNTVIALRYLQAISPTLNYEAGHIASLPIIKSENEHIATIANANISLSRADWDAFETSWDFKRHPLVEHAHSVSAARFDPDRTPPSYILEEAYNAWEWLAKTRWETLKANEEELNRIFIDIYGLQDELTPEVADKDVTVRRADKLREVKSFISYAVGCMFGRYSPNVDGLAYAGGAWDAAKYKTFVPDKDNVLPITDMDYFDDDVYVRLREFVRVVYGAETVDTNMDFIAATLYPDSNGSTQEKIRRYFMNDFYKDHVKIYQKKPIYWQFDSGKGAFKALVYLHRYDKYTVGRVRTEYMHPLQRMYDDEIKRIGQLADLPETTARERAAGQKRVEILRKKIAECREYDAVIAHIALQNPELDLDNGVKVNYAKFQDVEVVTGDGRQNKKMDLLTKI